MTKRPRKKDLLEPPFTPEKVEEYFRKRGTSVSIMHIPATVPRAEQGSGGYGRKG